MTRTRDSATSEAMALAHPDTLDDSPALPGRCPETALHDVFGFAEFRPGQRDVIDSILAGRDTLAVMPTGAGKSLCFQLPAVMDGGLTVVVSPLIALMEDQVRSLRLQGVCAAAMHSGNAPGTNGDIWRQARSGELRLLYIAPERLALDGILDDLSDIGVTRLVVDEAHCISQWGHAFRPDYLTLARVRERLGVPTAAFTATADAATRRDIVDRLCGGDAREFVFGFDRPNLDLRIAEKRSPVKQLLAFLEDRKGESGIVYCLSRRAVEETAAALCRQGIPAVPYHAGLDPEVRSANQDRFVTEDGLVVCATIAFGMGIDKPDVRFVFHTDVPGSVEAYYQEIGRAGRDGLPATVQMLYGLADIAQRRRFVDESGASEDQRRIEHRRLNTLLGICETAGCRRQALLAALGEPLAQPCGNCDTCREPPETLDGLVPAQKVLSAILRTGQRFGAGHIVDVLVGGKTEAVQRHGHDSLPTFGVGAEFDRNGWRSVIRQLVACGIVAIDTAGFGGLTVGETGRAVLKGEAGVTLRRDTAKRTKTSRSSGQAAATVSPENADLLRALKEERRDIARELSLPAYTVLHDRSLIELAERRPSSLEDFAGIHGVGQAKLEKFGERFLAVIRSAA
ncbi:DNA helicase RecQ [Thalassobaculum salexigens]|uniref:DNA helicase RecQ n=1 Tax=Thalassobaculum salexigens TaxID=455360 RepID=UPI00042A677E|nr:DNA helicase RecQ [Thalassobaculum salexigens]